MSDLLVKCQIPPNENLEINNKENNGSANFLSLKTNCCAILTFSGN